MKLKAKIPYILIAFSLFSIFLLCLARIFPSTASEINRIICTPVRNLLSILTSPLPFSVFEMFILISPILIILAIRYVIHGNKDFGKRFFSIIALISLFPTLYILTLGISYKAAIAFNEYESRADIGEIVCVANILTAEISEMDEAGKDVPTLSEIADDLSESYSRILHAYGTKDVYLPKPKPLILSSLMSKLGILALYSFPTGEVNINTDIPAYMIPFTLAHEYAHKVGAAGEAEANFLAFLACRASDSAYIRYSGNLSVLEYFLNDIAQNNGQMYKEVYKTLPPSALSDISLYREYYEKNSGSLLFSASDKINSAHLNTWDPNGSSSYSKVTVYVTHYLIYA